MEGTPRGTREKNWKFYLDKGIYLLGAVGSILAGLIVLDWSLRDLGGSRGPALSLVGGVFIFATGAYLASIFMRRSRVAVSETMVVNEFPRTPQGRQGFRMEDIRQITVDPAFSPLGRAYVELPDGRTTIVTLGFLENPRVAWEILRHEQVRRMGRKAGRTVVLKNAYRDLMLATRLTIAGCVSVVAFVVGIYMFPEEWGSLPPFLLSILLGAGIIGVAVLMFSRSPLAVEIGTDKVAFILPRGVRIDDLDAIGSLDSGPTAVRRSYGMRLRWIDPNILAELRKIRAPRDREEQTNGAPE